MAVLPISEELSWSKTTSGLVQSAFFWGYLTTQILGGVIADRTGGRRVLAAGVFVWSVCTALTPVAARISLPALLAARVLLGVGEGVAMPAMNAIVARWVPVSERARSLSFVYSGMYAGSIAGLATAPALITAAGWPAVFFVFGAVGIVWVVLFLLTTDEKALADAAEYAPVYDSAEREEHVEMEEALASSGVESEASGGIPAPAPDVAGMLRIRAVQAIMVAHFCVNWGYFVLLAWLPTFLSSRFGLDITKSSLYSSAPWVAMFVMSNIGGSIADGLIARGVSVTHTRKLLQSIGFLGPAVFLGVLRVAQSAWIAMLYISCGLGLGSFSQSGVYSTHIDIAPGSAGVLLGISNTFASLPGMIGVYATGVILDATGQNWNYVWALSIAFYIIGLVTYDLYATSERQW